MSTIHDSPDPSLLDTEADPFRYGWRSVVRRMPDGSVDEEQLPLTLDDLLHPEENDRILQRPSHVTDCCYLLSVFETLLAGDPSAAVRSDCRVSWKKSLGVRPMCPDVAVFLGARFHRDKATFNVPRERARQVLALEVTSPDTRIIDFRKKMSLYHKVGFPLYVIVDARERQDVRTLKIHGFRAGRERFEPLPLDDRGRLWLEPLGVWLGVSGERVACFDGATGAEIGDYARVNQARIEAEARADEAETRATEAEARVRELEAELRRLHGEAR